MPVKNRDQAFHLPSAHTAEFRQSANGLMHHAHFNGIGKRSHTQRPRCGFRKTDRPREKSTYPTLGISKVGNRAVFMDYHSVLLIELISGFGKFFPVKRLELFRAYVANVAIIINCQFFLIIRKDVRRSFFFNRTDEFDIFAGRTDFYGVFPCFQFPFIGI